ncbi:hypothetical protein GPECTOR_80g165 [Gonium pectorale]|uniref:Uncharacterized protein n=1 Tax=Gonium pectorale TaxID=33097 RepID=A0A150G2R7_GONPE|nr:hypothetical protein GPECTOR_80g165 [Gonium pectorale]|eukprot:KXZ43805.1 hypothetical protein GPECTOR_80g165 [Gonium pectorale]
MQASTASLSVGLTDLVLLECSRRHDSPLSPPICARLSSLLRSHLLQAAGRQLALVVDHLADLEPGQWAGGWIITYAVSVVNLICFLILAAIGFFPDALTSRGREPQLSASFLELLAALEDSWVLEHVGRTLLLLAPQAELQLGDCYGPFVMMVSCLSHMCIQCTAAAAATATATAAAATAASTAAATASTTASSTATVASRLRHLLSGRCLRHAVLASGVVGLCAADGGPDYGLPGGLRAGLQRELNALETADMAVRSVLLLLRAQTVEPPQQGRSGGLAFAPRAGAAALQRLQLQPGTGGGVDDLAVSVVESLLAAMQLLPSSPPASSQEHWLADRESWWQLAGGACAAASWLPPSWLEALGELLAVGLLDTCDNGSADPSDLPPAPAPKVAAALRGGALACLERLMRCAGREPQGPHADVLRVLVLSRKGHLWRCLAPLLAYGDPHRAAALVATVGKLLRLVAAQGPGALRQKLHAKSNWDHIVAESDMVTDAAVAHGPLVRVLAVEAEGLWGRGGSVRCT